MSVYGMFCQVRSYVRLCEVISGFVTLGPAVTG
jgi:hypothetical protein